MNVQDSTVTLSSSNDLVGLASITTNSITAPTMNGTATNAMNLVTPLAGDVTGFQSSTTVANVSGQTASAVATATLAVNTANTMAKRDGSGSLSVANITGNFPCLVSTNNGNFVFNLLNTQNAIGATGCTIPYTLTVPYFVM
jgi:hypothetical protein